MNSCVIRYSVAEDAQRLRDIYNFYVRNAVCTFDEVPRTLKEQQKYLAGFRPFGKYRGLVAEVSGELAGFATSSPYRLHPAFRKTIEVSIYLDSRFHGQGVGSALYAELFESLRHQDLHCAVSGIALPNEGSVRLHEKFGFEKVGVFNEYAMKNQEFISSVWLQKRLSPISPHIFRKAKAADQAEIRDLIYETLREYGLRPDPVTTDRDLEDLQNFYFDRNGWFEVLEAEAGGADGTFGLLDLGGNKCELRKMYLRKSARGKGLGKAILERALDKALELGYKTVVLETASVLKEAIGLYQKYGFRELQGEVQTDRCDRSYCLSL